MTILFYKKPRNANLLTSTIHSYVCEVLAQVIQLYKNIRFAVRTVVHRRDSSPSPMSYGLRRRATSGVRSAECTRALACTPHGTCLVSEHSPVNKSKNDRTAFLHSVPRASDYHVVIDTAAMTS